MDLTLSALDDYQISVACDGVSSHTFDVRSLVPDDTVPGWPPHPLDDPDTYGLAVYQALFPSATAARRALDAERERLVLVAMQDDIAAIPWEYAHDGDEYLVTRLAFVRGLPPERRISRSGPEAGLHIVAVPSNPLDVRLAPLDIDGEWQRLREIVGEIAGGVLLQRARPAGIERLGDLLAGKRDRVVHFMGHGGQGPGGAFLACERDDGTLDLVEARALVRRVRRGAFLVMLNACVSATPGPAEFGNLAEALVHEGVPYALGMRFSIADDDARAFSRAFYGQLARGVDVEEALLQARLTLARRDSAWAVGVPVLYTALAIPVDGFAAGEGELRIDEGLPPLEVSALPRSDVMFRGRVAELTAVGEALTRDARARIVTIHGPGGQGKTTLAREAVERFAWAWPGGVWAISLETVPSRAAFTTRLAGFLGIAAQEVADSAELERQALGRLGGKRTLLVLDNAETLAVAAREGDAAALDLVRFLREGALSVRTVGLLVTAREFLEWPQEEDIDLQGLAPEDGAQVFAQSAPRRSDEIDEEEARLLSVRVGGHPLSLRLLGGAFNEIQTPFAAFAADHERRLTAAENIYKGPDHRHRTLYASIETSVRYLPEELRAVLRRLWVFRAPFLPEVAAQLFEARDGGADEQEVSSAARDALYTLWRRGLLTREQRALEDGSVELYRVPPTVHPYIERYLARDDERATVMARFGVACASLVADLYRELDRSAALVFVAQQAQDDLRRALEHIPPGSGERAGYLTSLGWIVARLGDRREGLRLLGEALPIRRAVGDRAGEATTLNNMALVYDATGEPARALALYEEALPIARAVGDRAGEATTLNNMAAVYWQRGDRVLAADTLATVIQITREIGAVAHEAAAMVGRAVVLHAALGRTADAIDLITQATDLLRRRGLHADAAGETLSDLERLLASIRGDGEEGQASPATLPEDQVGAIVVNTVGVMTRLAERREEWTETMRSAARNAEGQGPEWQVEREFFAAVLAVLDGGSPALPDDHPYAAALTAIRQGIAEGVFPDRPDS